MLKINKNLLFLIQLTIANKNFQVVPFYRVEYSDIEKPKIYTIRLKATNQGDIYAKLKLAFGKEILLAPLSIVAMYVEVLDQISNEAKTFLSIYTQLAFNLVFEENFSIRTEYKLIKMLVDDMANEFEQAKELLKKEMENST